MPTGGHKLEFGGLSWSTGDLARENTAARSLPLQRIVARAGTGFHHGQSRAIPDHHALAFE
jgi:hypothetical protein